MKRSSVTSWVVLGFALGTSSLALGQDRNRGRDRDGAGKPDGKQGPPPQVQQNQEQGNRGDGRNRGPQNPPQTRQFDKQPNRAPFNPGITPSQPSVDARRQGRPGQPGGDGKRYIGVNPSAPVVIGGGGGQGRGNRYASPTHRSNKYTQENFTRASGRINDYASKNKDLRRHVDSHNNYYNQHFSPIYGKRNYSNYYGNPRYSNYYRGYSRYGFWGGYSYPVRPFLNFGNYFYYPVAYWMFNTTPSRDYYHVYYDNDDQVAPWEYAGVFYPTDTLRDLAIEVSGMENQRQAAFRDDMNLLIQSLADQCSRIYQLKIRFSTGDLVLNHYENLGNQAIVVEGFIDREEDNVHLPFKALLDLTNTNQTTVFVPSGSNPTREEVDFLNTMNQRITQLGGDPYAGQAPPAR